VFAYDNMYPVSSKYEINHNGKTMLRRAVLS